MHSWVKGKISSYKKVDIFNVRVPMERCVTVPMQGLGRHVWTNRNEKRTNFPLPKRSARGMAMGNIYMWALIVAISSTYSELFSLLFFSSVTHENIVNLIELGVCAWMKHPTAERLQSNRSYSRKWGHSRSHKWHLGTAEMAVWVRNTAATRRNPFRSNHLLRTPRNIWKNNFSESWKYCTQAWQRLQSLFIGSLKETACKMRPTWNIYLSPCLDYKLNKYFIFS